MNGKFGIQSNHLLNMLIIEIQQEGKLFIIHCFVHYYSLTGLHMKLLTKRLLTNMRYELIRRSWEV